MSRGAARPEGGGAPGAAPALAGGAAALALAGGFAALAAWSWAKWTDVHIDFGIELYLAWRLSEGDVLYRDLAYRHGPLSPYLNALWFDLFGVSLRTLVWVNLTILAGIAAMSWRLFAAALGRGAAAAACAVLLGVFGFSQYTSIANYNYVTPYQHPLTHGIALSMAMILLLGGTRPRGAAWRSGAAGLCLGGVLLTKAELAVPAALAAGVALAVGDRRARAPRSLAAFATGAALPALGFTLHLASRMPLADAVAGVIGNFRYVGAGLLRDPFYAGVAGTDDPWRRGLEMLRAFALLAGFGLVAALADRLLPVRLARSRRVALIGLALFTGLALGPRSASWLELARALPLVAALATAGVAAAWLRSAPAGRLRLAPLLVWAAWSLALLAKMPLHARFGHYGFALAMPATLLLVALLIEGIPARLRAAYGGGRLARALAAAAVAAGVLACLRVSSSLYSRKTLSLGSGADTLLAEAPPASFRGARVRRAWARLSELVAPDASLLVLPDGISFNYFLRRRSPTRFYLFVPPEIAAFGEDTMLAELRANPPDFVALVHRGHREFGVGPFGEDPRYGRGLLEWVRAGYERIERIGPEPFGDAGFGVVLLRRRGGGEGAEPAGRRRGRRAGGRAPASRGRGADRAVGPVGAQVAP